MGGLAVHDAGTAVELGGRKQRAVLAALLLELGRPVSAARLEAHVWGDDPPASAAKSVQTFVLRLRNALEPHRSGAPALLLTDGPGYRLAVDATQVDAERFARLARLGQQALADSRPESAGRTLGEALALWRGPAYAGFDADFAHAEARRLEELRLAVTEDRIAVRFAYEWRDDSGSWFRSYGNENWEFDEHGLMRLRIASINDLPIKESERKYHWPLGPRPDDHPSLSALGL